MFYYVIITASLSNHSIDQRTRAGELLATHPTLLMMYLTWFEQYNSFQTCIFSGIDLHSFEPRYDVLQEPNVCHSRDNFISGSFVYLKSGCRKKWTHIHGQRKLGSTQYKQLAPALLQQDGLIAKWKIQKGGDVPCPRDWHVQELYRGLVERFRWWLIHHGWPFAVVFFWAGMSCAWGRLGIIVFGIN